MKIALGVTIGAMLGCFLGVVTALFLVGYLDDDD